MNRAFSLVTIAFKIDKTSTDIKQVIREFGIRNCLKKLVISQKFCIFVIETQIVTNHTK